MILHLELLLRTATNLNPFAILKALGKQLYAKEDLIFLGSGISTD
jgi:hypothetical protein